MRKASKLFGGFIVAVGLIMAVISIGGSSAKAQLAGMAANVLPNQIVSYINSSCQTDPLNACPGAYHSMYSAAYLYVPADNARYPTARATVTGLTANGLSRLRMHPLIGNVCQSTTSEVFNPGNYATVQLPNTAPQVGEYRVYCVVVETGPSIPYPTRENVGYSLVTDAGSNFGVWPRGYDNIGTGFFAGNSQPYTPANPNWWQQSLAFSAPCNTTTGGSIVLYDLDTYAVANQQMIISVTKTLKSGVPSPDAGVPGGMYRVALGGDLIALGNQYFRPVVQGTGANWRVDIQGEPYYWQYIYILTIQNIGSANKIRISLPAEHMNASINCASPPSVALNVSCVLGANSARLITDIMPSDPNNDIVAVGGSATGGYALNIWHTEVDVPYSHSGTVHGYAIDSVGLRADAYAAFACPADPNRPPTGQISATCTRNAGGFAEVRVTISNVSDPNGDPVTITGNSGVGNVLTTMGNFGPFSAPLYDAPSAFSGSATLVVRDPKNASNSYSAGYTCPTNNRPIQGDPNNPGDGSKRNSAVCSSSGILPVNRELGIVMYMRDPDGGFSPVRASSNGLTITNTPYATFGGGYLVNGSNGSYTSPGSYPSPARNSNGTSNTYTVTFQARDAQSGVWQSVSTATYFCYRNPLTIPTNLNCSITSSGSIEPGAQLQPAVTVFNQYGLTGRITYTLTNAGTGTVVPGGNQPTGNYSPLSGAYGAGVFTPITMPSPGSFNQGATLTMVPGVPDDPTTATCGGAATITVNNLPYFRVLYGDIVTYTDSVRGWNRGPSGSYTGASANGMILSEDGVCPAGSPIGCGVASMSGAGTGAGGPLAPRSLTLSNSGGGTFGQGFGSGAGSFTLPIGGGGTTLNSNQPIPGTSGTYINDNGNTVTLSGNTVNGVVTVYSNNTAGINIGGNILVNAGPYTQLSDIPRVRIVAVGPIYIWPGVTRVDAELISNDKIYTCHTGLTNTGAGTWGAPGPINVNLYDAGCNSRLVVNGALMARNGIKMTRVQGTLRNSTTSDGINNCAAPVANCNNIAELIRFMPDLYITKPQGNPTVSAELRYDAVTALSPLY